MEDKKLKICSKDECVDISPPPVSGKEEGILLRGRDYPAYKDGIKMDLAMIREEALEWFSEKEIKEHQKKKLPFTGSLP